MNVSAIWQYYYYIFIFTLYEALKHICNVLLFYYLSYTLLLTVHPTVIVTKSQIHGMSIQIWNACLIKHLNKSHHYYIRAYTTVVSHWCQCLKLNVNSIFKPFFNYLWILIIPHIISVHKQDFTELQVVLTVSKIVKSPLIILEEWMWLDFFHTIPPQSSCSVNNSISFYNTLKHNLYRVKTQKSVSTRTRNKQKNSMMEMVS
jgi:hypothetical protein